MSKHTTELYFESHITIEPVFDEQLFLFKQICDTQGFKAAELLMKKRSVDTPERSEYDTFCTARDVNYEVLLTRTLNLVQQLTNAGFDVWRYKLENTLLDVRLKK